MFKAWQQAQKVAVPEWLSEHIDVNYDDQREDDQHSYWSGYNQALREIKSMLEVGEKK